MTDVVFFFGGYHATEHDMENWEKSAMQQRPDVVFVMFPYPPCATAEDPLRYFAGAPNLAKRIKTDEKNSYIIVGHSSGCAIANEVARQALQLKAENFRLVCLDGFRPGLDLLTMPSTQCWSAVNDMHVKSLNYHALEGTGHPHFNVYICKGARGLWPIHFSLVNKNTAAISSIATGYNACQSNLEWL